MSSNLDKYKDDLRKLLEKGQKLLAGFTYEYVDDDEKKRIEEHGRLDFNSNYESWYSEALKVVQQIIPERLDDFIKFYKVDKRKEITLETYTISDALIGITISRKTGPDILDYVYDTKKATIKFEQQLYILQSANQRFESSLFDIKQLVQADLFDSELDAAKELNKKGFTRGAGAIAGVVLESHLSQVCSNHSNKIKIKKKNPTINDYNEPLKENDVIDMQTWRFIQHLADLRNLCDHSKKREPKKKEVEELIEGVDKITKTVF